MKKGIQPRDKSDWSGWMGWHKSRGFRRVTWAVIDGNPVHFSRLSAHFPFEATKKKDILCQTELVPHCQSASSPIQTILAPSSPATLASWRGAKQLRCENRKQSVGRKTRLGVACPVRSDQFGSTLPSKLCLSCGRSLETLVPHHRRQKSAVFLSFFQRGGWFCWLAAAWSREGQK